MNRTSIAFASLLLTIGLGGCTVTTTTTPPPPGGSCSPNAGLACASGTSGWSCSGAAQPEDGNQDLVCSVDNGNGDFCCASSSCSFDPSVGGCAGGTVGYSCAGGASPPDASDPTLVCSEPTISGPDDLYCCYTNTTVVASSTCMQDFSVVGCAPDSYGFSCTGTDTPDQDYSNLTCSAGTGGGPTLFCCTFH